MASTTQSSGDDSKDSLDIAIVGGGIIGAMVALGLLRRGMRVTMYERASDWHEIGAAFAFTGVARECMKQLDPRVMEAFAKVGEENIHPENRFWDGFKPKSKEENESQDSLLLSVSARNLAFWGCLRSHLLHGLAAQLPEGVTKFGKQLESYVDDEKSSRVVLHFADGSVAEADAGLSPPLNLCFFIMCVTLMLFTVSHWLRWDSFENPADTAGSGQPGFVCEIYPQGRLSGSFAHC